MSVLITLCARGGSKGIPDKNIKLLNKNPLINYSIKNAFDFKNSFENVDIILSTDSVKIINTANMCGLKNTYLRPERLADDKTGKIEVIHDVLLWQEKTTDTRYDYILDLDITSPLRNLADMRAAFQILEDNKDAVNLFSVSPSSRSPYFNMVEQKENGFFSIVKKTDGTFFTRQSAPKVYDLNASFYFYRRSFFDMGYKGAITDKSLIYEVPHLCFDLDDPVDFEIMAFLIENKKLDFEL